MASSWLAGIGGAAGGLEQVLARHREDEMLEKRRLFQERQQTETERSNKVDEAYRATESEGRTADRTLQRELLAATAARTEARANVDDDRAAFGRLPMNTIIAPGDRDRVVKSGAVPAAAFDDATIPDRQATRQGVPESLAQNESVIKLRGTPSELASEASRAATIEDRAARNADRDEDRAERERRATETERLARDREARQQSYGGPVVVIGDASTVGGARVVPRGSVPAGGAPAAPPPGLRTTEVNNEVGLDQLDRLETMFHAGASELIGPLAGRGRAIGQQLPGVDIDPKFNDFAAATAAFRNAVIKAITGAQMSELEARRIREQIPDISDKKEVWLAKAQQTRLNLGDLSNRLSTKRPDVNAAPPDAAAPTPGDPYEEYMRRRSAPR
jgi:hypothetical protein